MRPALRLRVAHFRGGGGHPGPKGRTYDIIIYEYIYIPTAKSPAQYKSAAAYVEHAFARPMLASYILVYEYIYIPTAKSLS